MIRRVLLAILIVLVITPTVCATQHLIRAGRRWDHLAATLRPGDEIIFMPGRHRPGSLEMVQGTAEQPIVIRSINAENLATIDAESFGIQLRRCRFVTIKDVIVDGATISGLELTSGTALPGAGGNITPGRITLDNVTVRNTGPRGLRHAIALMGLSDVEIRNCRAEGWGGAAIDIARCDTVQIRDCVFAGNDQFTQIAGIQIHASCLDVRVNHCTFTDAGETVLSVGAGKRNETSLPPMPEAKPGTLYEARKVWIEYCTIRGGGHAALFAHCDLATFRNNTIADPKGLAILVKREEDDPRLDLANRLHIESNLIQWSSDGGKSVALISPEIESKRLTIGANLWWHEDEASRLATLEALTPYQMFPQVVEVNPRLDESLKPGQSDAEVYGAHGM